MDQWISVWWWRQPRWARGRFKIDSMNTAAEGNGNIATDGYIDFSSAPIYFVSNVFFFTLTPTLDSHVCVRALGTAAWFIEWKFANKIKFVLQIEYFIPYSFFLRKTKRGTAVLFRLIKPKISHILPFSLSAIPHFFVSGFASLSLNLFISASVIGRMQ